MPRGPTTTQTRKKQFKRKTYASVAYGTKTFSRAQLKLSIYSKEFFAIYKAFLEIAHILWETTKSTTVLTDIKKSHVSSREVQFHQCCGMLMTICCNLTLPSQSTQQLTFSPDYNSKSRRRYVSNSGETHRHTH